MDFRAITEDADFRRTAKRVDLFRTIRNLAELRREGPEAEISSAMARDLNPNEAFLPWSCFSRADIVAGATTGGYLTSAELGEPADALRPATVLGRLGATVVPASANISFPILKGTSTSYLLTSETQVPTTSGHTVGQLNLSPRGIGGYFEISRLLDRQAPAARAFLGTDLVRVVANGVDLFCLQQLLTQQGVGTFSGTSLGFSTIVDAVASLGDGLDESLGFAASRPTAQLLSKRSKVSSANYASGETLWSGSLVTGQVAGAPAFSTSALTNIAALIVGAWSKFVIADFGGGIRLSVNPFDKSNFQTGTIGVRALAYVDAGATFPSAFAYAGAVS